MLSPLVVTVGWLLRRWVPDRARRFLQAALIMSALVSVIAIAMIYRQGTQPVQKALLLRNYGGGLSAMIAIIAAVSLALYAVRVARDRTSDPSADESVPGPDR